MDVKKETYIAPQCEVIEMELQGMIAASERENEEKIPWEG